VLIYRVRLATKAANTQCRPKQQVVWMVVGLVFFIAVLLIIRNHRVLSRYAIRWPRSVWRCDHAGDPAGQVLRGQRCPVWIRVGGLSIQPGEFASCAAGVFRRLSRGQAGCAVVASRRFLGLALARGRDLGPVLVAWLASVRCWSGDRPRMSLLFFGMFVALLYIATERTSWLVIGLGSSPAARSWPTTCSGTCRTGCPSGCTPTSSTTPSIPNSYQLMQGLFGMGTGGLFGTGLGQGYPQSSRSPSPTSSSPRWARSWGSSAWSRCSLPLRPVRNARLPDRDECP